MRNVANIRYLIYSLSVLLGLQADEELKAEVEEDVKEESLKHGPFDSVKVIRCVFFFFLLVVSSSDVFVES